MKNRESSSTAAFPEGARRYALSSELAWLCLPSQLKEPHRRLAWVNSICFLFLAVGLAGLGGPREAEKALAQTEEVVVPVVFMPSEQQPSRRSEMKVQQEELPGSPGEALEPPQVVAVAGVETAEPLAEAFAIPVQRAAALAPARLTAEPVAVQAGAGKPSSFEPAGEDKGSYPKPEYPRVAQRNRYEGTVTIEIRVEPSGAISSARVEQSSGYRVLDEAALGVLKSRWRFPPGKRRWLVWPCTFRLE